MSKVIEVLIDPAGNTTIQTKGFTGGECRQASKFLEQALGVQSAEQLTAEFYQSVNNQQSVQQSNRPGGS